MIKKSFTLYLIVAFAIGLLVMGLIWIISLRSPVSTKSLPIDGPELIPLQAPVMLPNKSLKSPTTGLNRNIIQKSLPWQTAMNLITTAQVEKIEVEGIDLKIYMKGGSIFTTKQPQEDAYLDLVKKAKSKIQIIK